MDKQKFWDLIDSVNVQVDCDDKEAVLNATREALCELSSVEIVEWYEMYRELHGEAYRDDLWDEVANCGIHATDDGFIDFRAWLISQGQEVYEAVMRNPAVLGAYVPEPREADFELYGYISIDAFSEKACKEALGEAGFAAFKNEWLLENRKTIEENAEWNGLSTEVCGERLFYSMLLGRYNIFKTMDGSAGLSLDAKLKAAKDNAGGTDFESKAELNKDEFDHD